MSEALILEPVNPQYDKRLFIESPEKYKFRTCLEHVVYKNCFFVFILTFKTIHNMFWTCTFWGIQYHNLLSYCGLTNARMWASEKDLPVRILKLLTSPAIGPRPLWADLALNLEDGDAEVQWIKRVAHNKSWIRLTLNIWKKIKIFQH